MRTRRRHGGEGEGVRVYRRRGGSGKGLCFGAPALSPSLPPAAIRAQRAYRRFLVRTRRRHGGEGEGVRVYRRRGGSGKGLCFGAPALSPSLPPAAIRAQRAYRRFLVRTRRRHGGEGEGVRGYRRRGGSGKGLCFRAHSDAHENIKKKTLSLHPARRNLWRKGHLRDVTRL